MALFGAKNVNLTAIYLRRNAILGPTVNFRFIEVAQNLKESEIWSLV
jgi:hypothetical protein